MSSTSTSTSTDKRGSITKDLFHNFKKLAFSKDVPVNEDSDFEQIKQQFGVLHQVLTNIRSHLTTYSQSMRSILFSSQALSGAFSDVLADAPKPNPFVNQLQDLKQAHASLINSDKQSERYLNNLMEDGLSRRINEELSDHTRIYKKIEDRTKLRSDFLYYKQKLVELQDERAKRSSKGKQEGNKDIEKFERNQQKLSEAQAAYEKLNMELANDIQTKLAARQNNYGPALNEFVNVEKQFANIYYNTVKDISNIEYAAGQTFGDSASSASVPAY